MKLKPGNLKMAKKNKIYRLAILDSHPIQYRAPLFRKLASHPKIKLTVYYCSNFGIVPKVDPEFGKTLQWDLPLLKGYCYKFLKNFSPRPSIQGFWGLFNPRIIRELFRKDFDAIWINGYAKASFWLGFLGAWLTQTPIFLRGESTLLYKRPWWLRFLKKIILALLFKRVSAFLAIGTENKRFYRYYGVPERKIFLTPYAVDNDFFISSARKTSTQKTKLKKTLGFPTDLPLILFVGKLVERKKTKDLLGAFEGLSKKYKASLVFVGEGSEKKNLQNYVKAKKIKNVFFAGLVNQKSLAQFYGASDIFVLPSVYEPWGLVINEAMCYSLPIVASNLVGGVVDLVNHGKNGFIYPAGNIQALEKNLEKLLQNPRERLRMGKNSFKIISSWNLEKCVSGAIKALKKTA